MSNRSFRSLRRSFSLVLTALAALVVLPASASAAVTVAIDNTQVLVNGDGKANNLEILGKRNPGSDVVTVTLKKGTLSSTDCSKVDPKVARCVVPGGSDRIVVNGKGGNDIVKVHGKIPSTLRGGSGSDQLVGGSAADSIHGDAGDDAISGRRGPDTQTGGPGWDSLIVSAGIDTWDGGADNAADDAIVAGRRKVTIAGKVIKAKGLKTTFRRIDSIMVLGTRGKDVVNARESSVSIAATLRKGADKFFGSRKGDFVDGGKGDDTLVTRGGLDLAIGGGGRDKVRTGAGADNAFVRDGRPDKQIKCGPGRDHYIADMSDNLQGCEREVPGESPNSLSSWRATQGW